MGPEHRPGVGVLVAATAVLAALAGAGVGLARSPLLDIDRVELVGAVRTSRGEVLAAAGLDRHRQLIDVDASRVRRRLERLPWVGRARVERHWPGTVRVRVWERVPVAMLAMAGGRVGVVDVTGRVLGPSDRADSGLPSLEGLPPPQEPGSRLGSEGRALVGVAASLPPELVARVPAVARRSSGEVELRLRPTGTVRFGPADDVVAKLDALVAVLGKIGDQPIKVLDVRVPSSPVLTRPPTQN